MIRRTATFRGQNEKDTNAHLKKCQKSIYKVKESGFPPRE